MCSLRRKHKFRIQSDASLNECKSFSVMKLGGAPGQFPASRTTGDRSFSMRPGNVSLLRSEWVDVSLPIKPGTVTVNLGVVPTTPTDQLQKGLKIDNVAPGKTGP